MPSSVREYVRSSEVWNSIFRHGIPRDRRTPVMAIMSNLFLHLHPVVVRRSGVRLSFTWCMGGLTCFLFLAEAISGILLIGGWILVLPPLLARTLMRTLCRPMGAVRFFVLAVHPVVVGLLPLKMVLRWLFNLQYFICLPELNLNL